MTIEHLPAPPPPEQVAAALERDGVAVVDRLVAPDVMDRVRSELQPYLDATAPGPDEFSGGNTRRTGGLVAPSATCRELVMHPLVLGTIGNVLKHLTRFQ